MLYRLKPSFEMLYSDILLSEPEDVIPEISYMIRTYPKELEERLSGCADGDEKAERLAQMLRDSAESTE